MAERLNSMATQVLIMYNIIEVSCEQNLAC